MKNVSYNKVKILTLKNVVEISFNCFNLIGYLLYFYYQIVITPQFALFLNVQLPNPSIVEKLIILLNRSSTGRYKFFSSDFEVRVQNEFSPNYGFVMI